VSDKPRLVYVCEGGDCSEKGSVELASELKGMLEERDPEKRNRLRKYPCFGGCEQGINVCLFPDRVFLSKVTTADLPRLVERLCADGPELKDKMGLVQPDVEKIVWELLDTGF
jgi:(2Fe-2S) ferredoxin